MPFSWIILLVGLLLLGSLVALYNTLVRKNYLMQEGWSGVDIQLKRRADLIPNLLQVVKGYAAHESALFEKVTQLRAQASSANGAQAREVAEGLLTGTLVQLFAVIENYPALKADKNFLDLQKALSEIEDQIQYARRYYNATVRDFNIEVQSFPSNLIAAVFHYEVASFFELENPMDKVTPQVVL